MVQRESRIRPRTELFIGLLITLVGVLMVVVGVAVDTRWAWIIGVAVLVIGILAVLGLLLPKRDDGTRIWQTDQGKAI
jgi:uncharacterized membrane protein HdeD (DUF308 family)